MTTLIVDIEADGLLPDLTTIWQISIIDEETEELTSYNNNDGKLKGRPLRTGLKRMMEADRLVMHNGLGYDLPAITKVYGEEFPIDWTKVADTLVLSRLGNPTRDGGHSLEAWAPRLGVDLTKVEHEDWTRWSFKMEHRCNIDTKITLGVWKRLKGMYDAMPEAVAIEHAVAKEVADTIARGFKLDVPYTLQLLNDLQSEAEEQIRQMAREFPPILVPAKPSDPVRVLKHVNSRHPLYGQLEPGAPYCPVVVQEFNPGSRIQIAKRLIQRYGWKPTKFTPGGQPEVSEDILRELPYPEAQRCADYLKIDKLIGQINSEPKADGSGGGWLHHVDKDGLVHPNLNPLKAVTGRLSCSSPNLQQVSTEERMRRAWIARDGYVLVGCDAEGLELRCLAHYLWPFDGGEYAKMLLEGDKKAGTDIHSVVMRLICFNDRDETKRAEYGWLYGAGDAKLGLIAWQDAYAAGKEIDYEGLGIEVKGKRKPSPTVVGKAIRTKLEEGITGLGELVSGIKAKAKATGKLKGLDGRTLWVRSEHSALNLLLQSAGIIIVKKAWTLIEPNLSTYGLIKGKDYGVVMQVHDEFQIEARPEIADLVGKTVADCIVEAGRLLKFRCPLAGAYDIGSSWAETH